MLILSSNSWPRDTCCVRGWATRQDTEPKKTRRRAPETGDRTGQGEDGKAEENRVNTPEKEEDCAGDGEDTTRSTFREPGNTCSSALFKKRTNKSLMKGGRRDTRNSP